MESGWVSYGKRTPDRTLLVYQEFGGISFGQGIKGNPLLRQFIPVGFNADGTGIFSGCHVVASCNKIAEYPAYPQLFTLNSHQANQVTHILG